MKLSRILEKEGLLKKAADDVWQSGDLKFRMSVPNITKLLVQHFGVAPGKELGRMLRGEADLPQMSESLVRNWGGKTLRGPRSRSPKIREKGPDIQRVWDNLVSAIWAETKSSSHDAADWYMQKPADQDMEGWLSAISADVAMAWKDMLGSRAEKWYDTLRQALRSGTFKNGGYENWDLRYRDSLLQSIMSDAWHSAVSEGWRKLQRNQKEIQRLDALKGA